MTDLLSVRLTDWLTVKVTDSLTERLADWWKKKNWLTVWPTNWLTERERESDKTFSRSGYLQDYSRQYSTPTQYWAETGCVRLSEKETKKEIHKRKICIFPMEKDSKQIREYNSCLHILNTYLELHATAEDGEFLLSWWVIWHQSPRQYWVTYHQFEVDKNRHMVSYNGKEKNKGNQE